MYPYTTTKSSLQLGWSGWYDYTWDNVQKYVPMKPGVYVLAVKLTNGNLRVFYVGQTENLDKRLKEHLADSEPNKCIKGNLKYACMFRYALIETQTGRDKAERALYKKFIRECNDATKIPDVEDVDINF